MKWIFLSFLFATTTLGALSLGDKEETISELLENPILGPSISSISVYSPGSKPAIHDQGVEIEINDFPGDASVLKEKLSVFLCCEVTQDLLNRIRKTVVNEYVCANRPVVAVFFSEQDLSCGHIDIVVLEAKVGSIDAFGNRFSSCKNLLTRVSLADGDCINVDSLYTALAWWNRTPFRYTEAILSPGMQPGTTNLELATKDRFPVRPYVGSDNTGNDETGIVRLFAGAQGLIFWDQQLSYQFTSALEPHKFYAHSANYLIPFFWRHQLQVYGGYSKLHAKSAENDMDSSGNSVQASGRYEIPIDPIYGAFLQSIRFGYDYKRMNNNLIFGGDTFSSASPALNQFMVGYYFDLKGKRYLLSSNAEIYFAPANLTGNQNNTDFQMLRPGAKSKYVYGRARLSYTQFFPYDLSIASIGALQLANQNLLPSEQLGLGGYETVRGYEEREVNVDNGSLLSLELRAPPLRPVQWWMNCKMRDEWMFYGFIDFGYGWQHDPEDSEKNTFWLLGIGPGMRYSLGTNVDLRADFGFPLHSTGLGKNSLGRWDLGATISY